MNYYQLIIDLLFSKINKTISRKYYWLISIIYHIVFGYIVMMTRSCSEYAVSVNPTGCNVIFIEYNYIILLVLLIISIIFIISSIFRLNDMNNNKMWSILLLIYPYSFLISIWLMVAKSKSKKVKI